VYCTDAVAKTGVLTLDGPSTGVWIILVDGALTGTNFTVVMAGGGQPCNVYWDAERCCDVHHFNCEWNHPRG